jgi:uncharacterized protein YndB with AHSA1/START domain
MSAGAARRGGDKAKVSLLVEVAPAIAFDVFTREIDLWWKRGPKFRHSGRHAGQLQLEPGVGGRLFETFRVGAASNTVEVGRVSVWEPPARLVFSWRNSNFAPHEQTEVEVRFDDAPGGTMVSVEHRGWSSLPPDHPARHGLADLQFSGMMGMWWAELLGALRDMLDGRRGGS